MRREIWMTNRDVTRASRKRKYWCDCDMSKVRDGGRCSVCKQKTASKRLKKDA